MLFYLSSGYTGNFNRDSLGSVLFCILKGFIRHLPRKKRNKTEGLQSGHPHNTLKMSKCMSSGKTVLPLIKFYFQKHEAIS